MKASRQRLLREFLMARRASLSPADVGLPNGSRRRTPGLRREELASLAGVGVTWYTWFEQGREIQVSANVLNGIARALRLTGADTAYLYSLAAVPYEGVNRTHAKLDVNIQAALDGFRSGPAIVFGWCFDVEAFNDVADAIFRFADYAGPFARNHIWRCFMDPSRRHVYLDWEDAAHKLVSHFRFAYRKKVGDPYCDDLVHSLTENSEEFRRFWNSQSINNPSTLPLTLMLPGIGAAHFTSLRFRLVDPEDWFLFLVPPADAASADAVTRLMAQASSGRALIREPKQRNATR